MFGLVLVGLVYSNLKLKPNQNFWFSKKKIETKPKFWQQFSRFFQFVNFLHTLEETEEDKGMRKLKEDALYLTI